MIDIPSNMMEQGKYYLVFYNTKAVHMIYIILYSKHGTIIPDNTYKSLERLFILLDDTLQLSFNLRASYNFGNITLNLSSKCTIFELTDEEILNQIVVGQL